MALQRLTKKTVTRIASAEQGLLQDIDLCAQLIRSSGDAKDLLEGRRVHARIARGQRCDSRYLANLLIEMYGKCRSLEDARLVFEGIEKPNMFSWNIMIQAYAQNGHLVEAQGVFDRMPGRNQVSWNAMVTGYASKGHLQEARRMFSRIPQWALVPCTAIVGAYAQHADLQGAKAVFDQMLQRDIISWTVMVAAYAQNGDLKESVGMFEKIPQRDAVCWTTMLQAYALNAHLEKARSLFNRMPQKNLISWTVMIYTYAQNGHCQEALDLFQMMDLEGVKPDEITFVGILTACSHAGLVKQAWEYFTSLRTERGLVHLVEHYHCMIDVLGRAGQLKEAEELVSEMPFMTEVVAWTSLLDACRIHGDVERGAIAAKHLLDSERVAPYVLLSNIYAGARRQEDVVLVRQTMKDKFVKYARAGQSEVTQDAELGDVLEVKPS